LNGRRIWKLSLVALTVLSGCGVVLPSQHPVTQYTPLVAAVSAGDMPAVRTALDGDPALVRRTEWDHQTLLHDAVEHNQQAVAAFLLDRGARVNAVMAHGITPLHLAAQSGNLAIIDLLVARGAKLNPRDDKGRTPLDRAVLWHHPEAADYLRARGARAPIIRGGS
jgi:ankyrin repeat protein